MADATQAEMLVVLRGLLARATTWLLRSRRLLEPTEQQVKRFAPAVQALHARVDAQGEPSTRARSWMIAGVPPALAARVDHADALFDALDVAEIAESSGRDVEQTAQVHAGVAARLRLQRLRQQIDALPADTYWQGLARLAMADELTDLQRSIAQAAISGQSGTPVQVLDHWEQINRQLMQRAQRLLAEQPEGANADPAMLSVALRELRNLV